MRINDQIRAATLRVIGKDGEMVGVITLDKAFDLAKQAGLDLVEISPNAQPPVAKIIDFGKYRYDQQKREKDQKKAQHNAKVKEVKFKPNIDTHDLHTKVRKATDFLQKGFKVRITCTFRGREMAHQEIGHRVLNSVVKELVEVGHPESAFKMVGRILSTVIAPGKSKTIKSRSPSDEVKQDKIEATEGALSKSASSRVGS